MRSVPRASGDKPVFLLTDSQRVSVFPAPAGINRIYCEFEMVQHCVPRASGDKPPRKSSEPPTLSVPRASGDKPGKNTV